MTDDSPGQGDSDAPVDPASGPAQPAPSGAWGQPPPGWGAPPGAAGGYPSQPGYPPAGYPQTYQPGYGYPPGYPAYGAQPSNGMGTAALVLGIVAVVMGIIPPTFWLGWILGILAIIFGSLGRGKAKRGEATNAGAALAGLITGIVAIVVGLIWFLTLVAFVHSVGSTFRQDLTRRAECLNRNANNPDRFTICGDLGNPTSP